MRSFAVRVVLGVSFALLVPACSGSIVQPGETQPGDTTTAMEGSCPSSFPDGEACTTAGAQCQYPANGCVLTFECVVGSWKAQSAGCASDCENASVGATCLLPGDGCGLGDACSYEQWTCEANHEWSLFVEDDPYCCSGMTTDCPAEPPAPGENCDPCSDPCDYAVTDPCSTTLTFECDLNDLAWYLANESACTCASHTDPAECIADPACQFLTDECGEPSVTKSGCYEAVDCATEQPCPLDMKCKTMITNTCVLTDCLECVEVHICQ